MIEEYKPIEGNEHTLISNFGNVVSRYGKRLNYKPQKDTGYIKVKISKKKMSVHRLVALNFIPNPLGLPMVNHKDGIKTNNRVDNLEWCTLDYNMKHAQRTGLLIKGTQVHTCLLDELQVLTIIKSLEDGIFQKHLANYFGVDKTTIGKIATKKSWKHLHNIRVTYPIH